MKRWSMIVLAAITMSGQLSYAQVTGDAPGVRPDAIVDLKTEEGIGLVKGQWLYSNVKVIDVDHHSPGIDLAPSGPPNRTQDIDVAATRILEVAVPQSEADLPKALDALNMGFLPVPGLNPKSPETSFSIRGQALRVDLLTPALGARTGKPILIPRLKAAAQPLELLDYVLEDTIPVPIINGGATLVNVPDPARFALHKLLISARRQAFEQPKAVKDRQQAAELLAELYENRKGDLMLAVEALNKRAAVWGTRLRRELGKLPDQLNDARKAILRELRA